jgi:serine/threonine protein kinase
MIIDRGRIAAALPGYKIGAEVGVGAFGLVVAGRHRRLRRDVAIKVIPVEAAEAPGQVAEAELLASLDHPHIVRVHDYLEVGGLGLIVMELLAGGTLTRRRGSLNPPGSCAVGLAVAAGLGHAHERGILHRDIKMSNVLFDSAGTAKLSDFGIARMFTGSGITGTERAAGTPLYMAPEQIIGGRLGPPTDLYALGVLLYQLLAGAPPFDPALPTPQLWQQHLSSPPPPLRGVPHQVAEVVLRALAKDPADRPGDADSFAEQLAAAAVAAYGPAWLADTGLPLHLTGTVRRTAIPPSTSAATNPDQDDQDDDTSPAHLPASQTAGSPPDPHRFWYGRLRARRRLLAAATVLAAASASLLVVLLPSGHPATGAAGPQGWSRHLAAEAAAVAGRDPGLARRLAVAAYRTFPTTQARTQVLALLAGDNHPQATLTGHTRPVGAVVFSPNGQLLATGSDDGTARLWDTTGRGTIDRPLATLTGHSGRPVGVVVFSPNGQLLATGSGDGTARLWDTTGRGTVDRPLATLTGHTDWVGAVVFSPNGQLLATGSIDGTARLWDTTGRGTVDRPLATLTGHTNWVDAVAFSPNRQLLATSSRDNTARLWNVDAGSLVTTACATPTNNELTATEWHHVLPDTPYHPPCT